MKALAQTEVNHLAREVTSLITLWRLALQNGEVFGYTDNVDDIDYDDGDGVVTYSANTGYTRSSVSSNSSLAVDNLEMEGYIDMVSITDESIRAGELDYAVIKVMLIDYRNPNALEVILRKGTIGEITYLQGLYSTELRGLAQNLSQNFVEVYSATCRALLFDGRCKVLTAAFTDTATVTSVGTARKVFTVDLSTARASGFHDFGLATFDTGANSSSGKKSKEIKIQTNLGGGSSIINLFEATPYDIAIGDTLTIIAGCDKTFATCKSKFSNVANFRGEPHVPGSDFVARFPDNPQD